MSKFDHYGEGSIVRIGHILIPKRFFSERGGLAKLGDYMQRLLVLCLYNNPAYDHVAYTALSPNFRLIDIEHEPILWYRMLMDKPNKNAFGFKLLERDPFNPSALTSEDLIERTPEFAKRVHDVTLMLTQRMALSEILDPNKDYDLPSDNDLPRNRRSTLEERVQAKIKQLVASGELKA